MKDQIPTKSKRYKKLRLSFFALLLFAVMVLIPIPYYIEQPGSAENLKKFVTVNNRSDQQEGSFMLTTVGIRQATTFSALLSFFQPFEELESRENVMGNSSYDEYEQMQEYYMSSSQNDAIQVAFELAGQAYHYEYKGIYVMSIEENSQFKNKLAVGDTIYEIDGQTFESSQEFMDYVQKQKVGQSITISYEHNGKKATAAAPLIELKGKKVAGIGVTLVDHSEIQTDIPVKIDAGSIGGPSAGLMFSLEMYELLTNKNIRKGYEVAGTGTINSKGEVGQIGGIDKKVVAADRAGAELFFAPDQEVTEEEKKLDPTLENNYETAKKAAEKIGTKMKIVPVKTIQDALSYLDQL